MALKGEHSEVTVIKSSKYNCFGCKILADQDAQAVFSTDDPMKMYKHLLSHLNCGHKVPGDVFETLKKEVDSPNGQ